MKMEVLPDAEAASRRGAELIAAAAREAVAARGVFSIALSGGSTPWRMVALLDEMAGMPWDETHIFQVDERIAPLGSDERNITHLVHTLSPSHQGGVRPMPVNSTDLETAARSYESGLPERFDLIHLGIGPDGHTASLVPDDPVLDVAGHRVALTAGEYEGRRRMTLTFPELAAARQIVWLVIGEEAREPLGKLLAGDRSIPAARVENDEATVLADEAAAGRS